MWRCSCYPCHRSFLPILVSSFQNSTTDRKLVLVPLDGSARAEQALPVAACLARATDGTVKLIQVVSPPTTDFIRAVSAVVLPDLLDEDVQAAQEYPDTRCLRA